MSLISIVAVLFFFIEYIFKLRICGLGAQTEFTELSLMLHHHHEPEFSSFGKVKSLSDNEAQGAATERCFDVN